MSNRLIILGASVRAAAFSALRAGFQPYAIDLFADRDLTAVCTAAKIVRYPSDFLDALTGAPDVPWIYTGGLENHPRLVDQLARIRPLLGNPGSVLRAVRSPARVAAVASEARCHFPRVSSHPRAGNWLAKPQFSSSGRSVRWTRLEDWQRVPGGTYFQEFVPGQSLGAVFVAADGFAAILGITRQLVGQDFALPSPFTYVGSIGPQVAEMGVLDQLILLGHHMAERTRMRGLFNVDFVANDLGLWILEVNPRYSASIEVVERMTDLHFMAAHVAACRDNSLPAWPPKLRGGFAGKAVVYADRDAEVSPAFDELVFSWNPAGQPPGIADLPRIGQRVRAGDPVATVLVESDSEQAVERTLRSRVAEVLAALR